LAVGHFCQCLARAGAEAFFRAACQAGPITDTSMMKISNAHRRAVWTMTRVLPSWLIPRGRDQRGLLGRQRPEREGRTADDCLDTPNQSPELCGRILSVDRWSPPTGPKGDVLKQRSLANVVPASPSHALCSQRGASLEQPFLILGGRYNIPGVRGTRDASGGVYVSIARPYTCRPYIDDRRSNSVFHALAPR